MKTSHSTPRDVQSEIDIEARTEDVLRAFIDVEMMEAWWGVQRGLIEDRNGGVWALTWDVPQPGFGFVVLTGLIHSIRLGEYLRVGHLLYVNRERPVLGPMSLTIEVKETQGTSHLLVCQDGYGTGPDWDWYYQLVAEYWPPALAQLKTYLEGRTG